MIEVKLDSSESDGCYILVKEPYRDKVERKAVPPHVQIEIAQLVDRRLELDGYVEAQVRKDQEALRDKLAKQLPAAAREQARKATVLEQLVPGPGKDGH